MAEDYLRVGVIVTTHGIRGEVKVFPTTDDVRRFDELKTCMLASKRGLIPLEVSSVKYFKQFVILGFKGYDNINDVLEFVKKDLLVDRKDAVELKPGEYFICDLLGNTVVTDEAMKNFGAKGKPQVEAYESIDAVVDMTVLLELLGIGLALILISSLAAMISIQRFTPLTILKERS